VEMRMITAKTPADLIEKIRKIEGIARVEGDSLNTIQVIKSLYDIRKDYQKNRYVAIKKA
jgi:hypothetical protein